MGGGGEGVGGRTAQCACYSGGAALEHISFKSQTELYDIDLSG